MTPGAHPGVVEDAGGEDQAADEVGALECHEERDRHAVAVADEVGGTADDRLQEGDRVAGHRA